MTVDVIGREIKVGDYVFCNNYLYEVKGVSERTPLKGMLTNPSKTTRPKTLYGNQCCLITKEEYLIYLLKKPK